jgi:hypothetical protein
MKNLIIVVCLACLSVCIPTFGQYSETSFVPILNDTEEYLEDLKDQNITIARMEFDVVFSGYIKSTYRDFYSHREYTVVALGDSRSINDIDVKILKYNGTEWVDYLEDNSSNSISKIVFTPPEDGTYRIDITAFTFKEDNDNGYYGLIVYYK